MVYKEPETKEEIIFSARMIYLTDPYIYPSLFNSEEIATLVLPELMNQSDELFYKSHLYIAKNGIDNIGLICWHDGKIESHIENWKKSFSNQGVFPGKDFEQTYKEYIMGLAKEKHVGIYISNICLDKSYRHKGYGKQMLTDFCNRKGSKSIYLDVLKENTAAFNLYKKVGFLCIDEKDGFSIKEKKPVCIAMKKSQI